MQGISKSVKLGFFSMAVWLLLVTLPLFADGEKTYMLIFGSQDSRNSFNGAHSFAAFVKATDGETQEIIDTAVISWLPASGIACLFCPPEEGQNHLLADTLQDIAKKHRQLHMWGPFEVKPELFTRAKVQEHKLNNKEILYKAVDRRWRLRGEAINCEHTISDIDLDRGYLLTGTAHGPDGSHMVAHHLSPWIIDKSKIHPWPAQALGLDAYRVIHRRL